MTTSAPARDKIAVVVAGKGSLDVLVRGGEDGGRVVLHDDGLQPRHQLAVRAERQRPRFSRVLCDVVQLHRVALPAWAGIVP